MCSGGDLNPILGVCFPLFSVGVSLGNFRQGRKRRILAEEKLWRFVAALHTNFVYVLVVLCLSTGFGESQHNALLSKGVIYLRFRGRSPWGGQTLAAPSAINSPDVGWRPWNAGLWVCRADRQKRSHWPPTYPQSQRQIS